MSGMEQQNTMTERQRQVGSWLAGALALAGLALFIFSAAIVFVFQNGEMDVADKALLPGTALMLVANTVGFILIRRRNNIYGVWIAYIVTVIVIPVLATLVLQEIYLVAGATSVIIAFIFRRFVFPKDDGRKVLIFAGAAILSIVVIELLNPAFRTSSSFNAPAFGASIMALSVAGFLGFLLRRAVANNLRSKIVAGILVTGGVSILVLAVFAVSRAVGLAFRKK